jgi:uncharacterized membrane protein YGL010W
MLRVHPRLCRRLDLYSRSHSKFGNIFLHAIGIPCLIIAVLALVGRFGLTFESDTVIASPYAAWALVVGAAIWYSWLDWRVALFTSLGSVVCLAIANVVSLPIVGGLAAVGIIVHMIGHFGFEGKAPSTLSDPMSILDAPIWLVSVLTGMYRVSEAPLRRKAIEAKTAA